MADRPVNQIQPGRVVELGTDGPVHPILERDTLELIQERTRQISSDGVRAKFATAIREHGLRLPGLPVVTLSQRRTFEPVIAIQDDIRIPGGDIVAPAGTQLRPLEHATIMGRWVFVDLAQPQQLRWTKQILGQDPTLRIVAVHGDLIEAERILQTKLYLAYPTLLDRFGVERVPSVVTQVGHHFVIDEVALP